MLLDVRHSVLIIFYWCFFSHTWGSEMDSSSWLKFCCIEKSVHGVRVTPGRPLPSFFPACSNPWDGQRQWHQLVLKLQIQQRDWLRTKKFTCFSFCSPFLPKRQMPTLMILYLVYSNFLLLAKHSHFTNPSCPGLHPRFQRLTVSLWEPSFEN